MRKPLAMSDPKHEKVINVKESVVLAIIKQAQESCAPLGDTKDRALAEVGACLEAAAIIMCNSFVHGAPSVRSCEAAAGTFDDIFDSVRERLHGVVAAKRDKLVEQELTKG